MTAAADLVYDLLVELDDCYDGAPDSQRVTFERRRCPDCGEFELQHIGTVIDWPNYPEGHNQEIVCQMCGTAFVVRWDH